MNRIYDIADQVCFAISTILIGVGLGVCFAVIVIIAEIGLVRWP